jgi:hypothetical protein
MVLSVDYSSKALLGFGAVVGVAICTALFLRARSNKAAQTITPSLVNGRVSMADLPVIGQIYNLFNPTKPPLYIGTPSKPLTTIEELINALTDASKHHQVFETIVIYGRDLEIWEEPGILKLNPTKMILVGAYINTKRPTSIEISMLAAGWRIEHWNLKIVQVNSLAEAIKADLTVDPITFKPIPTVYSVV